MRINYEIDENNFLTGNWAVAGTFEKQIELDLENPFAINTNLKWDGTKLITAFNPKQKAQDLAKLRELRETECFSVINRGALWYAKLTPEQHQELNTWYNAWLDVTDKYQDGIDIETLIPKKPIWLT